MLKSESEANRVLFLNRDHIISVMVHHNEIVVTTTAGTTITIPAAGATLDKFVDELANHVASNFVAVVGEPRVVG